MIQRLNCFVLMDDSHTQSLQNVTEKLTAWTEVMNGNLPVPHPVSKDDSHSYPAYLILHGQSNTLQYQLY